MSVHPLRAEAWSRVEASTEGDGVAGGSYEIRIRGRLSEALQAEFEELEVTTEPVETVLHGRLRDQAELFGLLDRIQSLGLELVELRRVAGGGRAGDNRN